MHGLTVKNTWTKLRWLQRVAWTNYFVSSKNSRPGLSANLFSFLRVVEESFNA
ncbi:hypothetical protein KFK09_017462 [Dendrobium nobile]|uniref:Uncharacterized protein n=1 Tax=Dendrobium nobile TaxID=94219 RepID=A0A8T3B1E2_DENNO|nr:hypothetical protein KFK09_017462 [Dendrobium nobile]